MTVALEKARAAMRLELAAPRRSWKRDLATGLGALLGFCLLLGGVLLAVGACSVDSLMARGVTLASLLTVGALSTWAALRPSGRSSRLGALGLVVGAAVLLVLWRGTGTPSPQPEWVCTVGHLGLGLIPAAVVIALLRHMAPSRLRSVVAGLAAGTSGAFAGELACGQSALHVASFHLPAWAAVALLVMVVSSKVTPRSYAP